jgi:hypothetical protein
MNPLKLCIFFPLLFKAMQMIKENLPAITSEMMADAEQRQTIMALQVQVLWKSTYCPQLFIFINRWQNVLNSQVFQKSWMQDSGFHV